ncbi:MAG: hypothetical protein V1752_04210 [Candidatus Firestonebacteria bacterium]
MKKLLIVSICMMFLTACSSRNPIFTQIAGKGMTLTAAAKALGTSAAPAFKGSTALVGAPNYKYTAPSAYTAHLYYCALSKNADANDPTDTNPYVIINNAVASPSPVDMIEGTFKEFVSSSEYPTAGTYYWMLIGLTSLEQVVSVTDWPSAGNNNVRYKMMMSDAGTANYLDLLVYDSGVWKWMDNGQLVTTRSGTVLNMGWTGNTGWNDTHTSYDLQGFATGVPFKCAIRLSSPVVVPENPSGKWIGQLLFNVDNGFRWEDINNNDKFEPSTGDTSSTDYGPQAPIITVTFTQQ